ncbi:General transcription factor IIE subunit 2 [Linum grandiflorum]
MMALQQQLDEKQQEKMHSMLSSIAPKAGPSKSLPASKSAQAPVPAVKFSNDTERLQHINSIRKATVGSQMKRVIDLLFETRQAFTAQQINEACHVDVSSNKAVFESLKKNLKVNYDGRHFSYKDKKQLLHLIEKIPEGISTIDLKDAYPTVMEDLQALKAARKIWLLSNLDSKEDIAYPNDHKTAIKVDADLKKLFRGIELPGEMLDIEKYLQDNEMKAATNTAERRSAAPIQGISSKAKTKKKKHELSKRTKLTNVHLPELFQHLGS